MDHFITLTPELVLRLSHQSHLSLVRDLVIRLPGEKLTVLFTQRISGLEGCSGLRKLDLSYNFISHIENLSSLRLLKDLNLSENCVKHIEGLKMLRALETLNLAGNQIQTLPAAELSPLSQLSTLHLARNKVANPAELAHLSVLRSLSKVSLEGNPVCTVRDWELLVVLYVRGVEMLDGARVTMDMRQRAERRFDKGRPGRVETPSEGLRSVEQRADLQEQQSVLMHQVAAVEEEIRNLQRQLDQTSSELSSVVEKLGLENYQGLLAKRSQLKSLLIQAEDQRQTSQTLQSTIKRHRDDISSKEYALGLVRKQLKSSSLLDPDIVLSQKEAGLVAALKGLRSSLREQELAYDEIVVELQMTMDSINSLEATLKEKTAAEAVDYLPQRKDQLDQLVVQLRTRLEDLNIKQQALLARKAVVDATILRLDQSYSSPLSSRSEPAERLVLSSQSTPRKEKSQQAVERAREMWGKTMGRELEGGDLADIVIQMTEELEEYLQAAKRQQPSVKLELQIERLEEQLQAQNELKAQKSALNAQNSDLIKQIHSLTQANAQLSQQLHQSSPLPVQESLLRLNRQRTEADLDLQEVREQLQVLKSEAEDTERALSSAKLQLEDSERVLNSRRSEEAGVEMKERLFYVLGKLGTMLGVRTAPNEMETGLEAMEMRLREVQEDVKKAERFRDNKEKFVEMYESRTQELQTQWEEVAASKQAVEAVLDTQQGAVAALHTQRSELERVVAGLREEERRLKSTIETHKAEAQRVSLDLAAAQTAFSALKSQHSALKEAAELLERQVRTGNEELAQLKQLLEVESGRGKEAAEELRDLKRANMEQRSEKLERETELRGVKTAVEKMEVRKIALQSEIQGLETQVNRAKQEIAPILSELEGAKQRLRDIKEQTRTSQAELSDLKQHLAGRRQDKAEQDRANAETTELLERKKRLLEEAQRAEEILTGLRQQGDSSREAVERLRQDRDALERQLDALRREAEAIREETCVERGQLESLDRDLDSAKSALSEAHSHLTSLESLISTRTNEASSLLQSLSSNTSTLSSLKDEQAKLRLFLSQKQGEREEMERNQAVLLSVQAEKQKALSEIQRLYGEMEEAERRHRGELETLLRSSAQGQQTLKQLVEATGREKDRLEALRFESIRLQTECDSAVRLSREAQTHLETAQNELNSTEARLKSLKEEEETAVVLLALSGHKVDQRVLMRIKRLCQAESELQALKARLTPVQDTPEPELRGLLEHLESERGRIAALVRGESRPSAP